MFYKVVFLMMMLVFRTFLFCVGVFFFVCEMLRFQFCGIFCCVVSFAVFFIFFVLFLEMLFSETLSCSPFCFGSFYGVVGFAVVVSIKMHIFFTILG